jgi:hypothetical protein
MAQRRFNAPERQSLISRGQANADGAPVRPIIKHVYVGQRGRAVPVLGEAEDAVQDRKH